MGESSDRHRGEHQGRVDDAESAIAVLEDGGNHCVSFFTNLLAFFERQHRRSGVGKRCVGLSFRENVLGDDLMIIIYSRSVA